MVQRTIGIILIVAVLGIAAYDTMRYLDAHERLRETTYELAKWAGENAQTMSQQQAGRQLAAMAAKSNVTVYQYGQTENGAQVWTQTEVPDTIVAGVIANMVSGVPFSQATKAPFMIRDYREAGFQ